MSWRAEAGSGNGCVEPGRQPQPGGRRRPGPRRRARLRSRASWGGLAGKAAPYKSAPSGADESEIGCLPHLRVTPAGGEKLVVGALFGDDPVRQHDDAVGHAGGLEAVGDHHGRAAVGDTARRRGHVCLGDEVKIGGRLVQQQDGRVDQLAPGPARSVGADRRRGTGPARRRRSRSRRQAGDELVGAHLPAAASTSASLGVGPPVGDVVPDRSREQEAFLGHVAELASIGGQVIVAQVHAVDEDAARVGS